MNIIVLQLHFQVQHETETGGGFNRFGKNT